MHTVSAFVPCLWATALWKVGDGLCFYLSEQMCVFSGGQELSPLGRKQKSQAFGVGWGCSLVHSPLPFRVAPAAPGCVAQRSSLAFVSANGVSRCSGPESFPQQHCLAVGLTPQLEESALHGPPSRGGPPGGAFLCGGLCAYHWVCIGAVSLRTLL